MIKNNTTGPFRVGPKNLLRIIRWPNCFKQPASKFVKAIARGGYSHQNRTWMCLPDLKYLTFSIPIFALFPTHNGTVDS